MKTEYLEGYGKDDFFFYGGHVFSKGGKHFILGENGCSMIMDNILLESIRKRNVSENLAFKLVQHGLAHVPGKVMFCCEKAVDVRYFIIDMTKKCNFDCIYCFRNFQDERTIAFDTLKDILQYILNYCKRYQIGRIGLQMWGGEPLLAMDRIEYTVRFFENTDIQVSIDIETNASLITPEIAEKLAEWGVRVGVSLDGMPEIQNMQRRLAGGGPSAPLVERGIQNLQKFYKKDFGGIAVVTKHNFRYVKEMLDYYIYRLQLKTIKFNIVRDNAHAPEQNLALSEEEIKWFATELMDYLQAFRHMGAEFTEGNLSMRASNLLSRSRGSYCISCGCQGGRNMVSFDQNGNIFPCEMIDFPEEKIGSVYDDADLNRQVEAAIEKNRFFLPKKDKRCEGCPWLYYCQGGCSSRNRYLNRDGRIDRVECCLNQVMYPRLIEYILDTAATEKTNAEVI